LAAAVFSASAAAAVLPPLVRTLDSGLTVVTQKDASSAVSVLEILIKGGQRSDPPGREGLAYARTRLSMDIPDIGKVQDFMAKALHYSMTVRSDASVIRIECLTEFFDEALASFVEILTDPLINNIRLDRIKEAMAHQRRIESDDAVAVGRQAQRERFFQGTGYAGSIYGTEASTKEVKVREAKDYYERFFTAGNMVLVAVSNLEEAEMQDLLARRFKKLRATTAQAAPADSGPGPVGSFGDAPKVIAKDTQQNFIGAAFPLPPATPRRLVLSLLVENILGRGPGSRIWGLRTERKLAYNVGAAATPMKEAGLLEAFLETSPEKSAEAQAALADGLREFFENGVSAEELEAGKTELGSYFLRTNERKSSRAATLSLFESVGIGAGLFASFTDELAAVTLEETNAFIRAYLKPEAGSWVIIGPKK
jgi:predicted Zn-dependent peptidase